MWFVVKLSRYSQWSRMRGQAFQVYIQREAGPSAYMELMWDGKELRALE